MLEQFDSNKVYLGVKSFNCGLDGVNSFINKGNLKGHSKNNFNNSYVVVDKIDETREKEKSKRGDKIIAFYTLQAFSLQKEFMQSQFQISLPSEIPVARICMLGVDLTFQRKGIATNLIFNAIKTVRDLQKEIGLCGIYLDADKGAIEFYLKNGFQNLTEIQNNEETPMFLRV